LENIVITININQKFSDGVYFEQHLYAVIDGYHGNDGYIDGTIRILSTRQKAEEHVTKLKEEMKKGKRPDEQFSDYYNQTIMEIEIE